MPKQVESIDTKNPAFFLFLVDQSGSMGLEFEDVPNRTMAQGVADAINGIIRALVLRCSTGTKIMDRYYMGLIGYNHQINLGFGGQLKGQYQVPVSQVADFPLRIEERIKREYDGVGGILEQRVKVEVWLDPVAEGRTKMREALEIASETVADFVEAYPNSFPPLVINITDGVPTDATKPDYPEVEEAANKLKQITNANGNHAMLFNIHITPARAKPILYPAVESVLPNHYARLLFRMSSPMTEAMIHRANVLEMDMNLTQGSRGFVYQGDLVSVIQLLDIGTRPGGQT